MEFLIGHAFLRPCAKDSQHLVISPIDNSKCADYHDLQSEMVASDADRIAIPCRGGAGTALRPCCIKSLCDSTGVGPCDQETGRGVRHDDFQTAPESDGVTAFGEQIVHQAQRVLEEVEQLALLAAQGKDQLYRRLLIDVIRSAVHSLKILGLIMSTD